MLYADQYVHVHSEWREKSCIRLIFWEFYTVQWICRTVKILPVLSDMKQTESKSNLYVRLVTTCIRGHKWGIHFDFQVLIKTSYLEEDIVNCTYRIVNGEK